MASQQQVATLLRDLVAKGLETQDALSTVKALIEAKIYSLDQLTADNMPPSISRPIQAKLMKQVRRKHDLASGGKAAAKKKQKVSTIVIPPVSPQSSNKEFILINRSPVLILWATVVAQKLFSLQLEEALTVGSAYAAQCARAKGTSLGIFSNHEGTGALTNIRVGETTTDTTMLSLMNQTIRTNQTPAGLRAIGNEQEQDPHKIWKSLTKKMGDDLPFVLQQMQAAAELAGSDLDATAYNYYVHIRPDIPRGTKGWGAYGHLQTKRLSNFYPIAKSPPT